MASTALILDLDGTVWNSRGFYAEIISLAGGDFDRAMQQLAGGMPAARILRATGVSPAEFPAAVESNRDSLELYPEVRAVLERTHTNGIPLGVVTSLPGWIARPMLNVTGLSQFFGTIVDWNRCRAAKPSPRPLLLALEDLNINPSRTIWYVGDTVVDSQAAKAAGMSFAWAAYGYGPATLAGADRILDSFSGVLEL